MRRSTSEGKLFPHTMMVHDNHKLENHKDNACFVVKVLRENAGEEAVEDYELHQYLHEDPHKRIKASWVKDWISRDEGRWISCYEDFKKRSRDIVDLTKNLKGARKEKDYPEWGRVKEEILKILPELKLRVLNSEDGGERSLDFVPIFDGDNESIYDSLSIVVGGNKLSRGLTIEGLCISYYTRAPREFNSDTNIQRERWFGYRFEYIEFCRIFTSPGIYAKLKRSHVGLLDQMTQFIELNKKGIKPSRINFLFVESGDTYSTAKRGQSERKVIWFKDFFLRHVEVKNREIAKQNLNLFKDLKNNHAFENIYTQGKKNIRGIKTKKPISALALADFIEKLQFSEHNPKPGSGIKSMLTEYYKKPFTGRKCFENKFERFEGRGDPYDVAAYLRLWDALWHERNKRATYDYDLQSIHTEKWDPVEAPEFNIVFRHGSGSTSSSESKLPLTRKMIEVDGKVSFPWGARGYGQSFEDRNIDLNSPGDIRTKGLFIVWISSGAEGEYSLYRPIFGIVFPEGGPVAITRGQKWK